MTRPAGKARAWAELLRVSALFSVPGDALAGAVAAGARPGRGTLCAIGASLCLYEAGMALNDWADRAEDATERPHRPLPSGRITPGAALAASTALTAAGLALASRAGRPALAVATTLAATVWAYDLGLKHTPAGPATMATARALDLLLGATASTSNTHRTTHPRTATGTTNRSARTPHPGPHPAHALPSALLLGAHTYAVTAVSRHETQGGSTRTPLAALAVTLAVAGAASGAASWAAPRTVTDDLTANRTDGLTDGLTGRLTGGVARRLTGDLTGGLTGRLTDGLTGILTGGRSGRAADSSLSGGPAPRPRPALPSRLPLPSRRPEPSRRPDPSRGLGPLLALAYARTPATLLLHAALNPSAALTERAVGGGIRATLPLQATLAARAGAPGTALALLGLVPAARALARKVSPT